MQEILGPHNDDASFDRYLANWRDIHDRRTSQAIDAIVAIPGVRGLILAGSTGLGQPWPLSGIDLIPIYDDDLMDTARDTVEQARKALLDEWSTQGWRTGVDIGRLRFGRREVKTAFAKPDPDPIPLLTDDRWYYTMDKAWGGRAVHDPSGHAAQLAAWFTQHRFDPEVAKYRLDRTASSAIGLLDSVHDHLGQNAIINAYAALLKAIQWHQIHLMELWGQRDNSLGRFGTRFEQTAAAQDLPDLSDALNTLSGLDPQSIADRMAQAPAWVHERADRSWKARRAVNEDVLTVQNDRDVLRVCAMYELRVLDPADRPPWLAIPSLHDLATRARTLRRLINEG